MRWSKLKQLIEERFASPAQGRVHVHATRHHKWAECISRGWITIDGEEIYEASTGRARVQEYRKYEAKRDGRVDDQDDEEIETAGWEFARFLFEYLSMKPAAAFESGEPILQAMAVLDKRTGKRALDKMKGKSLHPLVARVFALRADPKKKRTA